MKQQLIMSFRLRRQRGMHPSRLNRWLEVGLLLTLGAWFWMHKQDRMALPAGAAPSSPLELDPPLSNQEIPTIDEELPAVIQAASPAPVSEIQPAQPQPRLSEKPAARSDGNPYTFLFEGRSTEVGEPSPNTHILIRIQQGSRTVIARGKTDASGFYSIPLTFDLMPKSSADWTLEANGKNYQRVELSGRHIALNDDSTITVERSFDLALR